MHCRSSEWGGGGGRDRWLLSCIMVTLIRRLDAHYNVLFVDYYLM